MNLESMGGNSAEQIAAISNLADMESFRSEVMHFMETYSRIVEAVQSKVRLDASDSDAILQSGA